MPGPALADASVDPADTRTEAVADGVWAITIPLPWEDMRDVNVYALPGSRGGIVLIDAAHAAHPTAWDALTLGLARAGLAPAAIEELVITHAHIDHYGLAERIVAASGCRVHAHPDTRHMDAQVSGSRPESERRRLRAVAAGAPRDVTARAAELGQEVQAVPGPLMADVALRTGSLVPSGLGPLRVVETPGHAPSHLALHLAERRLLFSGDLLGARFRAWLDTGYSDDPVDEYARSLKAVSVLDVACVLPGHGRPIGEAATAVMTYSQGLAARLAAIESLVTAGAETNWEIVQRLFDKPCGARMWVLRMMPTYAYLDHLVQHGRLLAHRDADGVTRYRLAKEGGLAHA